MSLSTVTIDEEGRVLVDGVSVADWLARDRPRSMPIAPPEPCDHVSRDDPRFANTCRKCGKRMP